MGLFKKRLKASVLLLEAEKADSKAEQALVTAQSARALAAQRRIEAARAKAEENSARLEKEAAEQDLRLAVSEQMKFKTILTVAEQNVQRAQQNLSVVQSKFEDIVGDTEITPEAELVDGLGLELITE